MLATVTQFVSDHALQGLIIFGGYVLLDDLLVLTAAIKQSGWQVVVHTPRVVVHLIADDVASKAVVAVAGVGLLAFLAGGADPQQAALDALVAGAVASTAVVINDIRVRIVAVIS